MELLRFWALCPLTLIAFICLPSNDLAAQQRTRRPAVQPSRPSAPATTPKRQRAARPRGSADGGGGSDSIFWSIFPPPGNYTLDFGLSAGTNFMETAYGVSNPNLMLRLHGGYRLMPETAPIWVYGVLDYHNYDQDAGPLVYDSHNVFMGAGGGALGYVGSLRLEASVELGGIIRYGTQTDGKQTFSSWSALPAAGFIAGMGFAIGGYVSTTIRGGARYYMPNGIGHDGRVDLIALAGLDILLGR